MADEQEAIIAKLQAELDEANDAIRKHIPVCVTYRNQTTADIQRLQRTLSFFRSVIQSGEPWTPTCERKYAAAMNPEAVNEETKDA